jgi:membrane-bound metal-dependent hydrolase YbcI (DUF457 family)
MAMPTPIGHALSGLTVAWVVDTMPCARSTGSRTHAAAFSRALALATVFAAVIPDADLLIGSHRGWTHSIGAALIAGAIAALWAGRQSLPVMATAFAVALSCATHAWLDWLGTDGSMPRGVMILWPFDSSHYFSPVAIFPRVERRYWLGWEFIRAGVVAVAFEIAVLGACAGAAWTYRARRQAQSRRLNPSAPQ